MTLKNKFLNYFYIIFNILEYFNVKINVRGIKRLNNRLARYARRKRSCEAINKTPSDLAAL
jgi:hypothetical protein